jgi:hypothetical protein
MPKYIAPLDMELNKNIRSNKIHFKILNKNISVEKNKLSLNAEGFNEARAYLDTFRAIINFLNFKKLSKIKNDWELINIFLFPPYKKIIDKTSGEIQGTKYCHFYHKIIITPTLRNQIEQIIRIANSFKSNKIDNNYYYWVLKWFTFCFDEISINPNNMMIIARSETLFIKFWTTFEILVKKNMRERYDNRKGRYLSEQEVKNLIELLINEKINNLDKTRNEIIHEGKIHNLFYSKRLPFLINTCHKSIERMFERKFRNINDLIYFRNNNWKS